VLQFIAMRLKPRLHQGNMLSGNMLLVAVNKIVASLLPVCTVAGYKGIHVAEIQATNMLPVMSNMLR